LLARDWRQIIADRRTLAGELVQLGRAAQANDSNGIKALAASKSRVRQKLLATATRDGFKECSSVGSAGLSRGGAPSRSTPRPILPGGPRL
jgi:hypothetical protein